MHFGGGRDGIRSLVSDVAPEFKRACSELSIAPVEGTPGRPTTHGVIERANRTALEWGRPSLEQSGLDLEWAGLAIKHGLMLRRLSKCNKEGVSIYHQKFPTLEAPEPWAYGAAVDFKPTPAQCDDAKAAPRGRAGLLVGWHTNPCGSWSGDYFCCSLKDFEKASGCQRVRIYRTKTCTWKGDTRPTFPIYEARERIRLQSWSDAVAHRQELLQYDIRRPLVMLEDCLEDSEAGEESPEVEDFEAAADEAAAGDDPLTIQGGLACRLESTKSSLRVEELW